MITISIICLLLLVLAALGLILWGLAYVLWPLLVILALGMLIDILVLSFFIKRKKK